ncbi:MAG: site-specific DNA-methyltransferase [Bacilli bacterium]|nr:site-specific DNA-methyltransferase [Bacilli bacterium]
MKDLPPDAFDYALTSPPYNRKRNDKYEEYDDTKENYYDFLVEVIENLLRITKNHIFFNIQTNYYNKTDIYNLIGDWSNYIQNILIWEKSNPLPASGYNITNAYELILVLGNKPLKALHTYTKNIITTSVNTETTTKTHKAVMKQEVADWIFEKFIPEGSTVIDPMMGLGTTAISAEKHNCSWFGYEIVPQYVNLAYERIISNRRMNGLL